MYIKSKTKATPNPFSEDLINICKICGTLEKKNLQEILNTVIIYVEKFLYRLAEIRS